MQCVVEEEPRVSVLCGTGVWLSLWRKCDVLGRLCVQGQCELEDQKGLDCAWAGNRTRASRVAGENSTTEPPMLSCRKGLCCFSSVSEGLVYCRIVISKILHLRLSIQHSLDLTYVVGERRVSSPR